jgi:hypothetical protein
MDPRVFFISRVSATRVPDRRTSELVELRRYLSARRECCRNCRIVFDCCRSNFRHFPSRQGAKVSAFANSSHPIRLWQTYTSRTRVASVLSERQVMDRHIHADEHHDYQRALLTFWTAKAESEMAYERNAGNDRRKAVSQFRRCGGSARKGGPYAGWTGQTTSLYARV